MLADGQLILNVLWRGAPSSLSKDIQQKVSMFFVNTHWRHFSLLHQLLRYCLLVYVCLRKKHFSNMFLLQCYSGDISGGEECLRSYISESETCNLLHIRRAGRSANGVWEISVLYPQGPVLCTRVTKLALIVYGLAWAWSYFFQFNEHLVTCKTASLLRVESTTTILSLLKRPSEKAAPFYTGSSRSVLL